MSDGSTFRIPVEQFLKLRPYLYHTTNPRNLFSIAGDMMLYSANCLAGKTQITKRESHVVVAFRNRSVLMRNQKTVHFGQIVLTDGWDRSRYLSELGSRVFFFPGDRNGPAPRAKAFLNSYGDDVLLRIPARQMFEQNAVDKIEFCKGNAGGGRMSKGSPAARGPGTFIKIQRWMGIPSDVKEVCILDQAQLPITTEICQVNHWMKLSDLTHENAP